MCISISSSNFWVVLVNIVIFSSFSLISCWCHKKFEITQSHTPIMTVPVGTQNTNTCGKSKITGQTWRTKAKRTWTLRKSYRSKSGHFFRLPWVLAQHSKPIIVHRGNVPIGKDLPNTKTSELCQTIKARKLPRSQCQSKLLTYHIRLPI